jgi:hypothetical protein
VTAQLKLAYSFAEQAVIDFALGQKPTPPRYDVEIADDFGLTTPRRADMTN